MMTQKGIALYQNVQFLAERKTDILNFTIFKYFAHERWTVILA